MKKRSLNLKIIVPIIGIIIGIVTVYIGITNHDFNYSYSGTVYKETYGGDAYTGIQQAAAQTATNTYRTYDLIQTFCQTFFVVLGALIILHYAEKLFENVRTLKSERLEAQEDDIERIVKLENDIEIK